MKPTKWYNNPPAKFTEIASVEQKMSIKLPEAYIKLIQWSNGGEGWVDEQYVSLWRIESLAILNEEYRIQHYLGERIIGFGTDGGAVCFAFDFRKNPVSTVCFDLGNMDLKEIQKAPNFFENSIKNDNS
jgi:hypothetical protein